MGRPLFEPTFPAPCSTYNGPAEPSPTRNARANDGTVWLPSYLHTSAEPVSSAIAVAVHIRVQVMERVAIGSALLKTTMLTLRYASAVGTIQRQTLTGTGWCGWDLHVACALSAI